VKIVISGKRSPNYAKFQSSEKSINQGNPCFACSYINYWNL